MKSVIQEASSVFKAIQLGWEKAGKPAEFTVKILEKEERNFIGLTTKQAKVSLFFSTQGAQAREQRQPRHHQGQHRQQQQQRPVEAVQRRTTEGESEQSQQRRRRRRRRYNPNRQQRSGQQETTPVTATE